MIIKLQFFLSFFSKLNIYTCKHKICNHLSYIYLICLGIKTKQNKTKKNNNNKNKNKNLKKNLKKRKKKKRNYKFN